MQTRADGDPNGVQQPHWRETKNALFMRMTGVAFEVDPDPDLPECFRDPGYMKKLLSGLADEGDFEPEATKNRRPVGKDLLHHSDRGYQPASDVYQTTLNTLGIRCSMSRTGDCYDNAAMERFFWSLKHEWTNHREFANLNDARLSVFKYIETFYNPVRTHQTLGYLSPDQYEAVNAPAHAA